MIKIIAVAALSLSVSGCAVFDFWKRPESVTVKKEEVARAPLNLAAPQPLKITPPRWIVVTPANAQEVWKRLRDQKSDVVLFALTDDGYEELAVDFAQIRNLIEQQRQIIIEYKKYYEPEKKPSAKEDKK